MGCVRDDLKTVDDPKDCVQNSRYICRFTITLARRSAMAGSISLSFSCLKA
jgi:hypothetical protein